MIGTLAKKYNSCQRVQNSLTLVNTVKRSSTSSKNERRKSNDQVFHSARDWAKQNPAIARSCLEPPPPPSLFPSHSLSSIPESITSLKDYLQVRNWKLPSQIMPNSQVDTPDLNHNNYALDLISHPLSYPLTLASQSHHFLNPTLKNSAESNNNFDHFINIRLLCIGARAEATLPTPYWQEFLWFMEHSKSYQKIQAKKKDSNYIRSIQWNIDFLGPDVPKGIPHRTILGSSKHHKLNLFCHHGYYPEYYSKNHGPKSTSPHENVWDGFVLFNPGIGHPNLQSRWEPTLIHLLTPLLKTTKSSFKPILFTAHSMLDAERDLKHMHQLFQENDMGHEDFPHKNKDFFQYEPNPFTSRMTFEDPFNSKHVVVPNNCVFMFMDRT